MKKLNLIISDLANDDLINIWLYIGDYSPQAADRFIDLIYEKCLIICESPRIGRRRDELLPDLRSFPVKRYVIFYREKKDSLEIVRVLSGYRDLDALF